MRVIVLLALVALVATVVWRASTAHKKADATAAARQQAMQNRPVPVSVVSVVQRTMPIYMVGLGTVTPYYSVTVKARVTGELMRVNFKEGQEVKEGQELMTIDPRPYQATLDQARGQLARDQAQLKDNQAEYQRYKALYDQGIVSKEQVDTQQANYGQYEGAIKSDQAAIDTAALNVTYCHITSPISGRVGLRLVDPGNVITANTTNLVVINQFKPIAVLFTLPEAQLPTVLAKMRTQKQLQAEAYDQSDTQHLQSGALLTADNQIDVTTGTDKLKAVFANTDEMLFPNQFVNVHLIVQQQQNALTIPAAAMQHGNDGDFVWVAKPDNTAEIRPVQVQTTEGSTTILQSGVSAGDLVITDGADKLKPGNKIVPRRGAGPTGRGGPGGPGGLANPGGPATPGRQGGAGGPGGQGGPGGPSAPGGPAAPAGQDRQGREGRQPRPGRQGATGTPTP